MLFHRGKEFHHDPPRKIHLVLKLYKQNHFLILPIKCVLYCFGHSSIRIRILHRIISHVVIQLEVYDVEHSAHTGQILIMFACLVIYRSLRYVFTHRRIRRQPAGVLRIESRTVVIEPCLLVLQLKHHDFEPLLNCQRTKAQNISWEYLAENSL